MNVVDGLTQMQIAAQLTDALGNGVARTAQIGIAFNASSTTAPALIVQAAQALKGTYNAIAPSVPFSGLWYAQAMENAPGSGPSPASYGGASLEQLSVQVAD